MSTAIAVAGDLALLPSGEVVSLSRSDAVHALGKMVRLGGDQNGGCGILKDGHGVQCWAVDPEKRLEAESIEGTGPVIDVTGSLLGGCAVRQAGTVVCWDRGQPDPPHNSVHDDEPLRTPDLLAPSPPTATSPLAEPLRVFPLAKVTEAVAVAGGREGCALHRTGAVSCWGRRWIRRADRSEQVYDREPSFVRGARGASKVAVGTNTRCIIDSAGAVLCWGLRFQPATSTAGRGEGVVDEQPRRVQGMADAVEISLWGDTACAVKKTGAVFCWGAGSCGNSRRPMEPRLVAGIDDARSVSVGSSGPCAIRRTGGLVCPACRR